MKPLTRGTIAAAIALGMSTRIYDVQEKSKDKPSSQGGTKNTNPNGPSTAGTSYRRHWNEEAKVWAWRKVVHSLYYLDKEGQIHAYQPGEDEARDKAFPAIAKKMGLVLIGRKERRAMHRAERARYKAIVKARGIQT